MAGSPESFGALIASCFMAGDRLGPVTSTLGQIQTENVVLLPHDLTFNPRPWKQYRARQSAIFFYCNPDLARVCCSRPVKDKSSVSSPASSWKHPRLLGSR